MNESKNILDYDIILLPYIAEIIASDKLTDDQRELQLRAIFKLRSILKYYANRHYLSKLINAIAEKKGATQNDLASTESTGPETDSSQNPESEYTAEEYTAELTDEEKLEKAYQAPCPITKYSGKTLAEVLTVDPHALVWVANKYKGNPEISEAAKLICEHALNENNE